MAGHEQTATHVQPQHWEQVDMNLAELDPNAFDAVRAEQFSERVSDILNAGAVAVMISVGHRSGLFDVMARLAPSSSKVIADAAQLSERYVREWLAVMVTGGIVDHDHEAGTYVLSPEHAASLTRHGALGNLAVYAQTVALMGAVQEQTLACFETGEGTSYDDYPGFHQFMAEDSAQTVTAHLFDSVLPLVPGIDARLTHGIEVLDAGCGRGLALLALARRYPRSRFTGYDLCEEAIGFAAEATGRAGLCNVRFEARDLSGFDEAQRYDLVTSFDAVHDQRDPQDLLRRLHRALRPGGVYLMQDIGASARLENNLDFPMAPLLYAISCVHCTAVSLGQGGAGLGTMWGWETAQEMLRTAGFSDIQCHRLPHDPMNVWFVSHKVAAARQAGAR
jgi:2-polyprenyl-3-methyl-5-hydroxy-6-metoxy-1,4-benzoquinol methylase